MPDSISNRFKMSQERLDALKEELNYLEEPYISHPLAGVMAQNKRTDASKKHVWSTGTQTIVGGK